MFLSCSGFNLLGKFSLQYLCFGSLDRGIDELGLWVFLDWRSGLAIVCGFFFFFFWDRWNVLGLFLGKFMYRNFAFG